MRILILAALMLVVSGCNTVQTAPQRGGEKIDTGSMYPVPGGRGHSEESGIVIAYEFVSADREDGICRLRLVETSTTRRSYFMQINRAANAAFVALPPGHYETVRLGCGITKTWDVGDIFKGGLQVEAGSASYAGKVAFVFKGSSLQVVERASRKQSADAFGAARSVTPEGLRLVSAFNLVPLTPEMASEGASASGFDVNARGVTGAPLNTLLSSLRQCEPKSKDPLQFGRLDYTAAYKGGRFTEFSSKKDSNAFNDSFKDCVSQRLTEFKPPTGDVEIHVVY